MALVVSRLAEAEEIEFLGRTATAKSDGHSACRQQVGDSHLFGDVKRMVQIETDDRGAETDRSRLAGQVQSEEQRGGQMPMMCVGMVLRKPRVMHAKMIGQSNQVRHFIKNRRRRLIPRPLEVVSQADLK